ncbi:hypothetical protein [Streptomyces sp. NPDC005181]|uniref:hypothetical protein n=1 Tax=Streptomyces sp. NPDC005181 TaxID=3156869 RepID=UPI0033B438F1
MAVTAERGEDGLRRIGAHNHDTDPPPAAMLAWAVAQVGLCLLAAPRVRRLLDRERVVGGAPCGRCAMWVVPA